MKGEGVIMTKRKTKKETTRCPKCSRLADRDYEKYKGSDMKWFECKYKDCGEIFALPILTIYPDAGIMEIQE